MDHTIIERRGILLSAIPATAMYLADIHFVDTEDDFTHYVLFE